MRYRLRTLMILLAVGPPVLAWLIVDSAGAFMIGSLAVLAVILGFALVGVLWAMGFR